MFKIQEYIALKTSYHNICLSDLQLSQEIFPAVHIISRSSPGQIYFKGNRCNFNRKKNCGNFYLGYLLLFCGGYSLLFVEATAYSFVCVCVWVRGGGGWGTVYTIWRPLFKEKFVPTGSEFFPLRVVCII